MSIVVNLDVMMAKRKISSQELAEKIGITRSKSLNIKNKQRKSNKIFNLGCNM